MVDRAARKVRVYAKLVYTGATNAQIQVRGCGRSTAAHDLQKSHDSCTDKIDLAEKQASGRFKDFYVNNKGTRAEVSDCTVDSDKQWPIREVEGGCKVFLDFTASARSGCINKAVMNYTDMTRGEYTKRVAVPDPR